MPLINSHCHVLNFDFVPDRFFRTRAPVRERMFRLWGFRALVWLFSRFTPGIRYKRLHEALKLMNQGIDAVAQALLDEMAASDPEIVMATPLMMDLELACGGQKPEVPYPAQIEAISRLTAKHPGRMMPFIMIDPRRPGAADRTIDCLENHGFWGVKMYPPLGYHPNPTSTTNQPETNAELAKVYEYCSTNGTPVTAHCSREGAYGEELYQAREICHECAQPSAWKGVLRKHPDLRLNLAHFGGDFLRLGQPGSWSTEICQLMTAYPAVYSDLSYHDEALRRKDSDNYFRALNELIENDTAIAKRTLFSTDWPMTRHTWRECDYVAPFRERCGRVFLHAIGFVNPMEFLFGENLKNRFSNYLKFLNRHGKGVEYLPEWLVEALHLDESFIPMFTPVTPASAS